MPSRESLWVKLPGCLAAPPRASVSRSQTEVSRMKGCSRLNSVAAPSSQRLVQDLLKTRLIRSSHVNAQPNIVLVMTLSTVTVGAETLWIDVSVVNPRCHHYIQGYRSNEVPDAAAKAMETSKRSHYSAVKDSLPLPPASVTPFVLETSGRLRPSALAFIQRVSGAHTYLMFQLLKEITFICAIYFGRMLETKFELMRANPHK